VSEVFSGFWRKLDGYSQLNIVWQKAAALGSES
jgi:hypothetical protein